MSKRSMLDYSRWSCAWFAAALLLLTSVTWAGNNHGFAFRAVGGVLISPEGIVGEPTAAETALTRKSALEKFKEPAADLAQPVELRMFSLRAAEEAIAKVSADLAYELPDEIKFMAGLQRIQYIFVYPEQNDVVLAGPGEGWKIDAQGNHVGITTGRPVLRIEDFILAMRTVHNARQGGISVSIDPSAEGRKRLDDLLKVQKRFDAGVLDKIEKALGPQQVSIHGVPATSRFARTLVASDYKMKRIAMDLQESPVKGLPSYIDMLKNPPDNMMPRWWMACHYEPIAKGKDGLSWEIRGQGVKVLTEDEIVQGDGSVKGTGKANPVAQKWADLMTEKYDELSVKEPIFGELRNLMDMSVASALIAKEDLLAKAGCQLPLIADTDSKLGVTSWVAPRFVDTQCSATKRGREFIITASGGVEIASWQVAEKTAAAPELDAVRGNAAPKSGSLYW